MRLVGISVDLAIFGLAALPVLEVVAPAPRNRGGLRGLPLLWLEPGRRKTCSVRCAFLPKTCGGSRCAPSGRRNPLFYNGVGKVWLGLDVRCCLLTISLDVRDPWLCGVIGNGMSLFDVVSACAVSLLMEEGNLLIHDFDDFHLFW